MLAAFDRGVGLELVTLLSLRTTDANIAVLPTAQKSQCTKERSTACSEPVDMRQGYRCRITEELGNPICEIGTKYILDTARPGPGCFVSEEPLF